MSEELNKEQEKKITEMIAKEFSFVLSGKTDNFYSCYFCGIRFEIKAIYPGGINMRMIDHYNAYHKNRDV